MLRVGITEVGSILKQTKPVGCWLQSYLFNSPFTPVEPRWILEGDHRPLWAPPGPRALTAAIVPGEVYIPEHITSASGVCYATTDLAKSEKKKDRTQLNLRGMDNCIPLEISPRVTSLTLGHNIAWRDSSIRTHCRASRRRITLMTSCHWTRWTLDLVEWYTGGLGKTQALQRELWRFRAFYMHKILRSPVVKGMMTLLQSKSQIIAILTSIREGSTLPGGPLQVLESAHYIPVDTAPVYDMKGRMLFFLKLFFAAMS